VDFEDLKATNIIVSGDRTYDIALRIKYTQNSKNDLKLMINENLELAIKKAVEITKPNETLFILPTYSAMLEARKILLGRKIL
jgi:UDP-N-acetylmuramyl tripeptide synthase